MRINFQACPANWIVARPGVGRLPLHLPSPDMQNRRTIDRVFAELGCHPDVSLESNSIVSILDLIGAPRGVQVLRLTEPAVAWSTGVVTLARDPGSPMVEARGLCLGGDGGG